MYKIKLIKANPIVGDIKGNFDLAVKHITQEISEKTDTLVLTPTIILFFDPSSDSKTTPDLVGLITLYNPFLPDRAAISVNFIFSYF